MLFSRNSQKQERQIAASSNLMLAVQSSTRKIPNCGLWPTSSGRRIRAHFGKAGRHRQAGNRQPCETHVRTGCGRAGAESRQPARPGSQIRYSKKHAGKDGGGRNMGKKNSSEKIRLPTVSLLLENQDGTTNQPLSKTAKAMVM